MRIVFFGTSTFAVSALDALVASHHEVVLCITQPARPRGRGLRVAASPVATAALRHRLPLLQPERPSAADSVQRIAATTPDLLVVIAYGHILRPSLLTLATHGAISLHPSLLPKYRGAAPISWAIINGEDATGVSIFRLTEGVDAGDLIAQHAVPIDPQETAVALGGRLATIGAAHLVESIDLIAAGRVSYRPQSFADATHARKLTKADGRIAWTAEARAIHNLVRGVQPWPGAHTWWRGRRLTVWRTRPADGDRTRETPGTIVAADARGVVVVTGRQGRLLVEELQLAGGTRLTAEAFQRGHRIAAGERFTAQPAD